MTCPRSLRFKPDLSDFRGHALSPQWNYLSKPRAADRVGSVSGWGRGEAVEHLQCEDVVGDFWEGTATQTRDLRWVGAPLAGEGYGKEGLGRSREACKRCSRGLVRWGGLRKGMGGGGGVPRAPRSRGTDRAGARWFPLRPRQERRCTAAGPGPVRPPPRSPGGFSGPGPPGPRGVVLLQGPVVSHLPGGRSAAPPPYRSSDPSSARRPGGCRARDIIAIAAASAHPGSRGKRRRSHGDAEGAAPHPHAGHSGSAPRLPPRPRRLAGLPLPRGPTAPAAPTSVLRAARGLRSAVLPLGQWRLPEAVTSWHTEEEGERTGWRGGQRWGHRRTERDPWGPWPLEGGDRGQRGVAWLHVGLGGIWGLPRLLVGPPPTSPHSWRFLVRLPSSSLRCS